MNPLTKFLLRFIKVQSRQEGDCEIQFKTLFRKIYIIEKKMADKELFLNGRLLKMYMEKL